MDQASALPFVQAGDSGIRKLVDMRIERPMTMKMKPAARGGLSHAMRLKAEA